MSRPSPITWTADMLVTIERLWIEGVSVNNIAKALFAETGQDVTRNMITGRSRRMGLKPRPSPITPTPGKPPRQNAPITPRNRPSRLRPLPCRPIPARRHGLIHTRSPKTNPTLLTSQSRRGITFSQTARHASGRRWTRQRTVCAVPSRALMAGRTVIPIAAGPTTVLA